MVKPSHCLAERINCTDHATVSQCRRIVQKGSRRPRALHIACTDVKVTSQIRGCVSLFERSECC